MATYRPLPVPPPYPCGHERTPANTVVAGWGGDYCRACTVARGRAVLPRPVPVVGPRIVAALTAHPGGLRPAQLRAALGYRQRYRALVYAVWWLRRRRGVPIESVREGLGRRYVLRREGA